MRGNFNIYKLLLIALFLGISSSTIKAETYFCPNTGTSLPEKWVIEYGFFFNPDWSEAGDLITETPVMTTMADRVFPSGKEAFAYMTANKESIKLRCAYKNLDPEKLIPMGVSIYRILTP